MKPLKKNNMGKVTIEFDTVEEAAANLADPNVDKTDNWIAGAKWMLEKLQDFDTWKEWKDITFKSE
jgi:hypothetical protein